MNTVVQLSWIWVTISDRVQPPGLKTDAGSLSQNFYLVFLQHFLLYLYHRHVIDAKYALCLAKSH